MTEGLPVRIDSSPRIVAAWPVYLTLGLAGSMTAAVFVGSYV